MTYNNILLSITNKIATITLNRPEKLNALNDATFNDLESALNTISVKPSVAAILITGSGEKAFVAGADINELNQASPQQAYDLSKKGQRIFNLLMNSSKPTLAAVNGFALGGGCELAMACHFRYASEHAKFGQPEVNLGLIPGYAGTQRLTRLIGKGRALELILTGDIINAETALDYGLVNKVFPAADLIQESIKTLEKIISKAPLAVKYCIESINKGEEISLAEAENLESAYFGLVHSSKDAKHGCESFISKVKPEFKGQ